MSVIAQNDLREALNPNASTRNPEALNPKTLNPLMLLFGGPEQREEDYVL